jgi:hypothetical protein
MTILPHKNVGGVSNLFLGLLQIEISYGVRITFKKEETEKLKLH